MIQKIDHVVITVTNIEATMDFYRKLGFEIRENGERYEFFAGDFKINVHILGKELLPHAKSIQPGSADLCFEVSGKLESYKRKLEIQGLNIEEGIVIRQGTQGKMHSIYLRDPDGNLVELCSYE